MNFITSSTILLRHLQSISGVINSSNTLPILDNFLFDIQNGRLTISASDLETTMITSLEVQSEENGKVALPAKLILDVLKSLPDQPCTIRLNPENMQVEIAYDNGKSRMPGINGDEFPKSPIIENKNSIKLAGEILSSAINSTLFATGNDDLRPVMNGVFCEFTSGDITFVATDAHKLVRYKRKDAEADGSSTFILPKKGLNMLKANLRGDEEILIEYNESNAQFSFNDLILVCRLVDGKYPNYEAVIPKESPNVLTVDRLQFLNAIKRVSIFSSKSTHLVKLKLAGAELALFAEDIDFANEATERLTCNFDGDDMEIGFNSRFLIEMLSNLDSNEVQLSMSESNRGGVLTPLNSKNSNEEILMLIMSVALNK